MASISGEKLKSPGKTHKTSSKRIESDNFDLYVIRQKIHNFYSVKKDVPKLTNILPTLKEEIKFPAGKEVLNSRRRLILNLKGVKLRGPS
jgi:hypothetical protein